METIKVTKLNNNEDKKEQSYGYNVICEYGNRHPLNYGKFDCNCKEKYGFESIDLKIYAINVLNKMYVQDITEQEKRECWKYLKEIEKKRENICNGN